VAKAKPKSNGEIKPKSKRGGRRVGAGRKSSPAKAIIAEAATVVVPDLHDVEGILKGCVPRCIANLVKLANGGFEEGEEKWSVHDHDGVLREKPVLVERKVSIAAPDRAANIYLIDRVLGKPDVKPPPKPDPKADDYVLDLGTGPEDQDREGDGPAA
jgi:hypothetical protein